MPDSQVFPVRTVQREPDPNTGTVQIDLTNTAHQEAVLKLCKKQNFYESDIRLWLTGEPTPRSQSERNNMGESMHAAFMTACVTGINERKARLILHGYFASDKSKTGKNPTGSTKAVGFVLYTIDKRANQCQVLFNLVMPAYRKKGHGSNMMNMVQRHLGNDVVGEKMFPLTSQVDHPYVLVHFMTVEVEEGSTAIDFYRTLGFAVASTVPGWKVQAGVSLNAQFVIMVDAGPRTWIKIRDEVK
jgi:ribosomal protein S18 acetylase RimI-like enzyme